ncbi:MAG TPA: T9SS type A sorting domain-containing protein, partial [Bacteroidia bacterium]|nr:T9SS type A sorting domain-containing protein [Bacteroidia bacterium]
WIHVRGGDGSYCQIEDGAGMYYFSIQKGKMNKATVDASGNVTAARRIDPIGGEDYGFINPFTLDANNQDIMYLAGGKYLWRNDDLSQIPLSNQWDSISTNWVQWADSVPQANTFITAVHSCKTPANRVYFGTDRKKIYRVDNANVGTPTPVDITPTAFPALGFISCITTNPNNGNEVMVCMSNYSIYSIYSSVDGGTTWVKSAGNLEQNITTGSGNGPSVRWLTIMPVSDGKVYLAATSTGLYATDTLMGTATQWVRQGDATIGAVVCDMIDVRSSDGAVVVATHANGIYSATITSVNDIVTVPETSAMVSMQVNVYPNPATDNVNVKYTLAKAGDVEIVLLDELGRSVQVTQRRNVSAGEQTETLNVSGLAAGIYYVRLRAGEIIETKGLIVE